MTLKVGDYLEVSVFDLTLQGIGVARCSQKVVFIAGLLPGEVGLAKIIYSSAEAYIATLVNDISKVSLRHKSRCILSSDCGGCVLQSIDETGQVSWKQHHVVEVVKRIGKIETVIMPLLTAPNTFEYRNKALIPLERTKNGRLLAGFYRAASHYVVNMSKCPLLDSQIDKLIEPIKSDLETTLWPVNVNSLEDGGLRHLCIKVGVTTGEVLITLISSHDYLLGISELAQHWMQRWPQVVGVSLNIQPEPNNVILSNNSRVIAGRSWLIERFCNLNLRITTDTFFQVNTIQAERTIDILISILGTSIGFLLGQEDIIFQLAITANRPDSLSITGIARELAALTGSNLRLPNQTSLNTIQYLPLDHDASEILGPNGIYTITEISGLQISPSPLWMQYRLENAGIQPVNNIVDIINYVMIEQGQPMHAYDKDAIKTINSNDISVASIGLRRGYVHESLIIQNKDEKIQMSNESLIITYSDHPIAIAGVIGGALTAVKDSTTSIWLEAAVYSSQDIRVNCRQIGFKTESSSRFEKGVSKTLTLRAIARVTELLQHLAGGILQNIWVSQQQFIEKVPIVLRSKALHKLLGPIRVKESGDIDSLSDECIENILVALDCKLQRTNMGWLVEVPDNRQLDLQREVDLIEEVARLIGFDNFMAHLPDPILPGGLSYSQKIERKIRSLLTHSGLQEMVTLSLVAPVHKDEDINAPKRVPLSNPLLAETSHLRESLWPEHIKAARRNLQASQSRYWAFEVGHVFRLSSKKTPQQLSLLSGIICGDQSNSSWAKSSKALEFKYYEARGILEHLFRALKIITGNLPITSHQLLHPGRASEIAIDGYPIGWFGQIHPQLIDQNNLPEDSYLFELMLEPLLKLASQEEKLKPYFKPFVTAPAADRDLSMIVPINLSSGDLLKAILSKNIPLLEDVQLIDRFDGDQLGNGKCSLTFRLRYRGIKETLTDKDINFVHEELKSKLKEQFPIVLRV